MQQTEQMCHLARNLEFKVKVDKSDLYRIVFDFMCTVHIYICWMIVENEYNFVKMT